MRLAAIYDIHGNLPALESVLEEVRRAKVEQIIVGGDVLPGPMVRETLQCLQQLEIPVKFIRGNGDRAVLERRRGKETGNLPEQARAAIHWVAEQLSPEDEQFLASWPESIQLEVEPLRKVLFCHATPRNDTELFTRSTAEERLLPVFAGLDETIVICGHTHMQFDRTVGNLRVVNAGSVGMPFGEPAAYWLLLGPDVELRCTTYDLNQTAQRVRATAYPQAQEFADRNVLHPPSEAEMLELFARVELK